jgi:hypothetical protein
VPADLAISKLGFSGDPSVFWDFSAALNSLEPLIEIIGINLIKRSPVF